MNSQQALQVLRKVIGYQPSQKLDDLTAQAWAEALAPYDVRDALDAVAKIAVSPRTPGQPFWMEPRDIVQEVRHMEAKRFEQRSNQVRELEYGIHDKYRDGGPGWREELKALRQSARSRDWAPPSPPLAVESPRPVTSLAKQISRIRNGAHPTATQSHEAVDTDEGIGCSCGQWSASFPARMVGAMNAFAMHVRRAS